MKINLDISSVTKNFLEPISRITDKCRIKVSPKFLETISATEDAGIILYGRCISKSTFEKDEKDVKLDILDLQKLLRVLGCISTDTAELVLDSNSLSYKSPNLKFKYHLAEEGIITIPKLSTDKMLKLAYDTTFTLTKERLADLLKGCTFADEAEKVYVSETKRKMYAELNDKDTPNLDNINICISEDVDGERLTETFAIDLEAFKMLASFRQDIKVGINSKHKVFVFDIITEDKKTLLKYIVTPLYK